MKILMMTNTYAPIVGGLEKSIQSFSDEFRAKGHEVKIVAPEFPNMPPHEKDVIRVPALEKFVGTNFSVSLPLPELISNLVEEYKPDIVHSHHPFLIGGLALRLCGQKNIPLVFTYHTMFEYYKDHFGMDHETIQKFVVDLAAGYANMVDQVIVPSESVRALLKERNITTPMEVVPTGIDVKKFAPVASSYRKKNRIPKNAFMVGHVGRLAPEKNLNFLMEAVAEFLRQEKKAIFLVVGSGPSERDMKKVLRRWNVEKRVRFAGILKGRRLIEAYHAMDAFVFASKSETQGMVVAEAMAAGLPVVALDAAGVREVVVDRHNGRLLNEESRKKFASALLWCSSRNQKQWADMRDNALKTAHTFSLEACAIKALMVYKKTVRRHHPYGQEDISKWEALVGRFKTEVDILSNLGRAAASAIVQSVVSEASTKERVFQYYEKQIQRVRKSWMLHIKKVRKQKKEMSVEEKQKLEVLLEEAMKKMRMFEMELAELNRKVFTACEFFEKHLGEAGALFDKGLTLSQEQSGEEKAKE